MHRKGASAGFWPLTPVMQVLSTHASFYVRSGCTQSRRGAFISTHRKTDHSMASVDHTRMANAIRGLAMDAVEKAKSGHPGLPMGAADIATVLWTQFLKYDAADPKWPDRDRFILSAGHGPE